jgi:3-methyladenine DNA glycosylase AlkD
MGAAEPVPDWDAAAVLAWLDEHKSPENIKGMSRFGIETGTAYGIPNAELRPLARKIKRDHDRAQALWASGIREARILACFTDEPKKVTAEQALDWATEFNSWEIVDHAASLFVDARLHDALIDRLVEDQREFVRRTGFAMMAWGAVHLKKEPDSVMSAWFPQIEKHAGDERNFVKKAVNWALRQIGKRSMALHGPALQLAQRLAGSDDKAARWIGRDAVRELSSQKTLDRLKSKEQSKTTKR